MLRQDFKDYFSWHSDLWRHENQFLEAYVDMEHDFHNGIGQNADWNNLEKSASELT